MLQQSPDLQSLVEQFLASGGKVQNIEPQRAEPVRSKHHDREGRCRSDHHRAKVISLHRAGKPPKEIREALRIDHRTLVRLLDSAGLDPLENTRFIKPTTAQLKQAKQLAREGVSMLEAARRMSVTRGRLRGWARRNHIRFGG